MLYETVMMFRNQCAPDTAFPVLTSLVLAAPKHVDPGPAGVFLTRLHMLNWQWDHNGFVVDHEHFRWHLLDAPIQLLKIRLVHTWGTMLGALMSGRKEFQGLSEVDRATSISSQKLFAADGLGLWRTAMNGTFYTRNKQIHAGKFPSKNALIVEYKIRLTIEFGTATASTTCDRVFPLRCVSLFTNNRTVLDCMGGLLKLRRTVSSARHLGVSQIQQETLIASMTSRSPFTCLLMEVVATSNSQR